MNYLAHMLLSPSAPESRLGNACADFVKGGIPAAMPVLVQSGIRLHRSIDAFSDDHPVLRECARLFPTEFKRYSGIMLDVAFDHFLARSWDEFAAVSLGAFSDEVYKDLLAVSHFAPSAFFPVVESMTTHDWLGSYRRPESVQRMLRSISARLRRANPLGAAAEVVFENEAALETNFRRFFPELLAFARSKDSCAAPLSTALG